MHLDGFIIRIYHDARSPERGGGYTGLLGCYDVLLGEVFVVLKKNSVFRGQKKLFFLGLFG